jgi:carboxypeptidase Q
MKIRLLLIGCIALLFLSKGWAQSSQTGEQPKPFPPRLTEELKQLHEVARTSSYAYEQLAHLCNSIGPRLSGSPQAEEAVKYVAGELERLGLQVQLEQVQVPHWVRGLETAELVQFPGSVPNVTQKIVVTALGGSVATPAGGISADVMVVDSFDQLATLGKAAVNGKIVLFNRKFDVQAANAGYSDDAYDSVIDYRVLSAIRASEMGAVASVVRSIGGADYRLPHTGSVLYAEPPRIPAGAVTSEDADLISNLVKQGPVRMHLTLTPQTLPDAPSFNVVADLKGTEHPEQIVIVSGHLDSWDLGTGAIDDGGGMVMAMQTAEAIQNLKLRPRRTIRVVGWMNEENGMRGVGAYLKDHKKELADHVAAIENDDGPGHPLGILAHASRQSILALQPLKEILGSYGDNAVKTSYESVGSDTEKLEDLGIAGFTLLVDNRTYFNYHHTPADTFDKVDLRDLQEDSALTAVLTYALANMDSLVGQ